MLVNLVHLISIKLQVKLLLMQLQSSYLKCHIMCNIKQATMNYMVIDHIQTFILLQNISNYINVTKIDIKQKMF